MRKAMAMIMGLLVATTASARLICGTPEPVGTEIIEGVEVNVYRFGNTEIVTNAVGRFTAAANVSTLDYIEWTNLNVQAGSKICFVGGVMLDSLPSDYVYDWSEAGYIWASKSDFLPVGATFTVPEGALFRYMPLDLSFNREEETFTAERPAQSVYREPLKANVVNNGKWVTDTVFGNDSSRLFYGGDVSGSGKIFCLSDSASFTFNGAVTSIGGISFTGGQNGDRFTSSFDFSVTNSATSIGNVEFGYSLATTGGAQKQQYLRYSPSLPVGETGTLTITANLQLGRGGGLNADSDDRRWGSAVLVCGGNTVSIGKVTGAGSGTSDNPTTNYLHFVADTSMNGGTFTHGVGNVVIDQIEAKQFVPVCIYPSANINLTVSRLGSLARTFIFDYTAESNAANVSTLDLSNPAGTKVTLFIKGFNPSLLPRTIQLNKNTKANTTLQMLDDEWTFPFDFTAASDEINSARCDAAGVLDVPETGTIIIENVAGSPIRGDYPLLTCTSGGEKLANWNVEYRGDWTGTMRTVKVSATGAVLSVKKARGIILSFK